LAFIFFVQVDLKEQDVQIPEVYTKAFEMLDLGKASLWDNEYSYPSVSGVTEATRLDTATTPVCFQCAKNVMRRLVYIYRAKMIGKFMSFEIFER
jgi:hypothetical protein